MTINASTAGVAPGNTDNGPALAKLFDTARLSCEPILLPPGLLRVSEPFPTITGSMIDLVGQNTTIQYAGPAAPCLFPTLNLATFRTSRVTFRGGSNVNTLISQVSTADSGGWTPTQWEFEKGGFWDFAGIGMHVPVGSKDNCDTTTFRKWTFAPGPAGSGGVGFQCENQNSLCNRFEDCVFANGDYSIQLNCGSFTAVGCTFSGARVAEILANPDGPCSVIGGWSQNSYRFMYLPYRPTPTMMRIADFETASFPQNWLATVKDSEYAYTEQQQDWMKYAAIQCNVEDGLSLDNVVLLDPLTTHPVYAASARPLTERLTWKKQNSRTANGNWATWTEQVFNQMGTVS